jgi:general secretion pathway protein N
MSAARLTQAALWALAALFLFLTVWPFTSGLPLGELLPAQRPQRQPPPPSLADLELSPLDSFAETLNRPLFTATRRPPSPLERLQGQASAPTAAAKGDRVILGKYALRGVIVTPEQKLLLLRQLATGQSLRLKVGDALDDWRIAAIAPDHLILSRGDKQEKVSLKGE